MYSLYNRTVARCLVTLDWTLEVLVSDQQMIDIHSHLLPNLDDGSRTVGQSVAVVKH